MKGWRTFAFGAALAVLGFAQQFDWVSVVDPAYVGYVTAGIGAMVMVLRSITTTPMGHST